MYKVSQLINNNGNGATNQFVLADYEKNKIAFQSYNSIIVVIDYVNQIIRVGKDWDYSNTTHKHRNIFMRDYADIHEMDTTQGFRKALNKGECGKFKVVLDEDL